jgi:DNA polymerase III sliding clamp (beta) subunit (PCNA family)
MKIERKALLAALEPLKPAIAGRTVIKELTHVWFDGKFAYAHDGGMGIRVALETPFKLGVPGSLLLALLGQAGADNLMLEAADDALAFKSGRSNVKLVTLPIEQRVWPYPAKPEGKPVASLKVSEALVAGLRRVFVVRPSNPKRMEHHAVCVFPFDKDLDLYTTDSKQLAVMPVEAVLVGKVKNLAIPRPFAEQLASQCKGEGSELRMYEDHFVVQATEQVTLFSNVLDSSEMLDLPEFADKYCDEKAAPPIPIPEGLRPALERAVLMAGSEDPIVRIRTSGKVLQLSAEFANTGELEEEFELTKALPKCSVNMVAKLLLAAKDVDRMMIMPSAINLRGKNGFMYIMAGHGSEAREEKKSDSF